MFAKTVYAIRGTRSSRATLGRVGVPIPGTEVGLDFADLMLKAAVGAAIGYGIGMTGMGGGAIVVPTLTLGFGLPPSVAVGTASLYAFLTKIYATYRHLRLRTVRLRASLLFLAGAVPGNVLASGYVNRQVRTAASQAAGVHFQGRLKFLIAAAMLASTGLLSMDLLQSRRRRPVPSPDRAGNPRGANGPGAGSLLGVLLAAVVGLFVGGTALGAGVMAIPVLLLCFRLTASQGVGSSIFIGLALTLISSLIYHGGGQVDTGTAVAMSAGSVAGVGYGSRMSIRLPEGVLKGTVIAVTLAAAGLLLFG